MTETTNHDRWSEDIAAYMLGALEPEEAAALERHAEGCERCREEIRWLMPALQALPESVEKVEPAPELRARLMAEVRAEAEGSVAASVEAGEAGRLRGGRREARAGLLGRARAWLHDLGMGPMGRRPVAGVAVAALVVVAVAGFAIGGGIGGGSDSGGGTSTVVVGHSPGVTAKMVNEGDSGTLQLANVRQLPEERVLEAWVQRDGEVEPVKALFVPDREGRASADLPDMSGVEAVMVTTEPTGGTRSPTSSPIVTIQVPQ
jgi:anti-sigma-K factor RskA